MFCCVFLHFEAIFFFFFFFESLRRFRAEFGLSFLAEFGQGLKLLMRFAAVEVFGARFQMFMQAFFFFFLRG